MLFGWFIWVPGCKREWLEITTVHLDINTQKTAKTARLAADRLCWAQFRTCNIVYRSKFSRLSTAGSVFPFNVSHAIIGFSLPIILDHLPSPVLFAAWASMAFDDPNWYKWSRVIFMACVASWTAAAFFETLKLVTRHFEQRRKNEGREETSENWLCDVSYVAERKSWGGRRRAWTDEGERNH